GWPEARGAHGGDVGFDGARVGDGVPEVGRGSGEVAAGRDEGAVTGPALDASIGFSLRVPPNWFELDVHPATRDASARELVRTRIAEVPELQGRRAEITRLLQEQAASAWEAGAVYCAAMAEA